MYSSTFLKLNIDENEWLKNLPMSGENEEHMRHIKIFLKKRPTARHKLPKVNKNLLVFK